MIAKKREQTLMVERYARKEMSDNWTMQAKYQAWLDVEIAVVKA